MKLNLAFIAFILFTSSNIHAQNSKPPVGLGAQANIESLSSTGIGRTYDDRYEGVKGSPFMFEKFINATVTLQGGVDFASIPVKYNVYENTVLYTNDKNNVMVFSANQVDRLIFNDSNLSQKNILGKVKGIETLNPKAANHLLLYLFDGKNIKFTALPMKELVKADFKGSSYSAARNYDEFFDKTEYYLTSSNSTISKVKLNKKNLLAALANKSEQIKSFIQKQKIDSNTEEGWIKTLAYYDTL